MPRQISQKEWDYWYDKIYGYFYRRLNDEYRVEELTSQTLNAFLLTDQKIEHINAFIWKTARFKFLDYLDSKKTRQSQLEFSSDLEDYSQEPDLKYNSYYLSRLESLKKCIQNQLSDRDVAIIEMCIMYDFNSQEAAKELNMTDQNVRQRLSRGLKKVRQECREIWVNN